MARSVIYAAIFIALIVGYVKHIESRGIYFPIKDIEFTPELAGISFEDVYFKTEDNLQLNGWFISGDKAKYTILFCHGNAGNIGHRLEKIQLLHQLDVHIFIIDYRGYGRSRGRPSEKGLYLDAKAAFDYLVNRRRIGPGQIILYGESLGTGVIIHLAAEKKAGALIAEGAFTRGRDMAKTIYPFLPAFLFSNSFDCLAKIKKNTAPILFIHSRDDEVVPVSLAKRLYNAAGKPKYFTELSGGHNSAFLDSQEEYISSIALFIESL